MNLLKGKGEERGRKTFLSSHWRKRTIYQDNFHILKSNQAIQIRYALKEVPGHHLLPSQILEKHKWEKNFDGMNVPNDIHLNLHSQELGGKVIFFFPSFTSSSQVLWFSLLPYPLQRNLWNSFNPSKPFFSRYCHLPSWKPA